MVFSTISAGAFVILLAFASPAAACNQQQLVRSTEARLEPQSVSAQEIGKWLTASSFSGGIRFTSTLDGHDLRLDITSFPTHAPEVGSVRAIMQLGRLAGSGFDRLLLVDGQEDLFVISEADLRNVGCQFTWPSRTQADPLMLMRELVGAIREESTGISISELAGSSLVMTNTQAMSIVQDVLNEAWVESARRDDDKVDTPDEDPQDELASIIAPDIRARARQVEKPLVLSGL